MDTALETIKVIKSVMDNRLKPVPHVDHFEILFFSGISHNKQVGYCLRTKLADSKEGGVMAGVGALDSPYLVEDLDRCDH